MGIQSYIVQELNIDLKTDARIQMWHDDFVVLKGPITVAVTQNHRLSDRDPYIIEPAHTVRIRAGETKKFTNEQYRATHPGDWNTEITLVSED